MSHVSRVVSTIVGSAAAALFLVAAAGPALADGMEPAPAAPVAPKRPVVRHVHHHAHHARRTVREPIIGFVVKHQNDGYENPVYAMPAWPSCRYVLDTFLVRGPADNIPGHWDCGG